MLKKIKELLKDSSIYGLSKVLSQLLNFLLIPIYTGYLRPQDYGVLAMTTLFSMLFVPMANMGLTSAVFRFITYASNDDERSKIISTGHFAVIGMAFFWLILSLIFIKPINALLMTADISVNYLSISVFTAFFGAIDAIPLAVLRIERRVKTVASISLANLSISMGLTILLVIVFKFGVYGSLFGLLIANAFTAIYLFTQVSKPKWHMFSLTQLRQMFSFGLPSVPHHLQAIGMSMYGQFMVKQMLSIQQAGLYNIAWKFTLPLVMITNAIQQSWGPYKFHLHKSEGNKASLVFGSIFNYYLAAILTIFTGMVFFMPYLFTLTVNDSFAEAVHLLGFLALIPVCNGLYWMLGTGIELGKSMKFLPVISLTGFLVTFLTASLFIEKFGAAGAGLSTALGWLSMAVFVFFYSQSIYKVDYDWASIFLCILLAVGAIYANYLLKDDFLFYELIAVRFVVFFLLLFGFFGVFFRSKSESARMKRVMHLIKNRKIKNE